jgi:signal transduction histidine kinase
VDGRHPDRPYAEYGLANPGSVPYPVATSALTTWLWVPAVGLFGIYLPLLFPDGKFPSKRWQYLGWFAGAVIVIESVGIVLAPGPPDALPGARNPFGLEGYPWLEEVGIFVVALLPLCILASAASLILRFRRSGREVRQQIKWLALAASLVGLAYLGTIAATLLFAPGMLGSGSAKPAWLSLLQDVVLLSYAVVPVAVGIAVLKHRLYDIDLVINRTLVYGSLTVSIVGVYALVVGYLGMLLRAGWNLPISLVATGLVAVLFASFRDRLQRGVNRLMYGERDDPYAVISRLGRRLEGTLAPEAVLPAIVENVAGALRLPWVGIWLTDGDALRLGAARSDAPAETVVRDSGAVETLRRAPDGLRPADLGPSSPFGETLLESGVGLVLPLTHRGEHVGVLCMAPRGPGEGFSPADRRLLRDLATQAGAAAHAVRLTVALHSSLEELRRSRERLVAAQEERRRIQRDLHDGLGPVLASMRLR